MVRLSYLLRFDAGSVNSVYTTDLVFVLVRSCSKPISYKYTKPVVLPIFVDNNKVTCCLLTCDAKLGYVKKIMHIIMFNFKLATFLYSKLD